MWNSFGIVLLLVCTPAALFDFAIAKWKADKNVGIEDAYKWTYQATRGGEHAVPDADSARTWLDDEWKTLDKFATNESLWEPLCRGEEIGRLNLRPFKARGGKEEDLLEAFLTSSREYKSEQSDFVAAWLELGKRLKRRSVGKLDYDSWTKLDEKMKGKNYPTIHHSSQYESARHPAYRVLIASQYKILLKKLK
jgi:hypothetical protein